MPRLVGPKICDNKRVDMDDDTIFFSSFFLLENL
jgi:hypothetical protein